MMPFSFPNLYPNPLNPFMPYQSCQNLMAYNPMNNFLFASQGQAAQYQYNQMLFMQTQLLQNTIRSQAMLSTAELKALKPTLDLPGDTKFFSTMPTIVSKTMKMESCEETLLVRKNGSNEKDISLRDVKANLKEMVVQLLDKIGRSDHEEELNDLRAKYATNVGLSSIFDSIVTKYLSIKKHREDIVRYIMRKALKFIKSSITKKEKVYGKRAYAILCKKYLRIDDEELKKNGVDTNDEKQLIEFLLPYRKKSKNRTINTNFTIEMFSSKEFKTDYMSFLTYFDNFLIEDNNSKVEKLLSVAEECLEKNTTIKIKKCIRLPWLQIWIEKTRKIAFELPNLGVCKKEYEEDEEDDNEENEDYGEEDDCKEFQKKGQN